MHQTVLLNEAVDALVTDPDGVYVDGTYGRGGHSALILQRLSIRGRLYVIDKDPQAIADANSKAALDSRMIVCHGSFADMSTLVPAPVNGVLLDLGVSSPQLDQADRGFSFLQDGPLDMRMDTTRGESAAQWIARASSADIAAVLREFGEERYARRIAEAIVKEQAREPIETTARLAKIITEANPAWEKHKHPATRSFQAIRIFINNELGDLDRVLNGSLDLLGEGGRLVVISFHSLEDRIVKRFIRAQEQGPQLPRKLPVMAAQIQPRLVAVGKAIKPSDYEVEQNARSRSAVMRVAEKPGGGYAKSR